MNAPSEDLAPLPRLVLVVVTLMDGVPVPFVDVVQVIAVGHGFVPAAVGMHVLVVLVGDMRQVVLVVMAFVRGMRVPLVDVVNVTLMRDSGVPALRTVDVIVRGMSIVPGSHGSAPPCCDGPCR